MAGLRFKEQAWPPPRKWMLSGELTSSGSKLASPSGKDDEFYHQAKKELQEAMDKKSNPGQRDAVS